MRMEGREGGVVASEEIGRWIRSAMNVGGV